MTRHLDTRITADLIRAALRESFPGVKFSVRISRYSMGSSVTVTWADGPTDAQVRAVTDTFRGDYFDGMIDYHGQRYHTLDGEQVHFGGSISTSRRVGPAGENFKAAWAALGDAERSALYDKLDLRRSAYRLTDSDAWFPAFAAWSFFKGEARPSATMARVGFVGDDGYGAGTVGTPGDPARGKGYPMPRPAGTVH